MSDVIFVRPHYEYDSYKDLLRLIELSGYPLVFYEEIDTASDNCYILTVLNGEINENGWGDNPRCEIIALDLEWRLKESDFAWTESDLTLPKGVSRVWASDKWYAERINAQYVPLGSHPVLVGDAPPDPIVYDVAPLAYRTGRRNEAFGKMSERGLTIAPNAWDPERDAYLKSCKSIVHVHQHERVATVAPLRFAIAAAWHKPLISEQVNDRGIFDECVLYADFSVIADYTALMTQRYANVLQDKADELHDTLCQANTFRSFIEKAL
jgi:hypothetical protein